MTRGGDLVQASGSRVQLCPSLPGPVNSVNLAFATAAAELGVPLGAAATAAGAVCEVDGRYRVMAYREHAARILLAKNPAGWVETLRILQQGAGSVVLAVNAREADGFDLSWLWDVGLEELRARRVVASGERAIDLSVRLSYAEVGHRVVPDPMQAIACLPPGPVDVIGNYTALRDLVGRLEHIR